jgi:hypothetical protein
LFTITIIIKIESLSSCFSHVSVTIGFPQRVAKANFEVTFPGYEVKSVTRAANFQEQILRKIIE